MRFGRGSATPTDLAAVMQHGAEQLTAKQMMLAGRRDLALSAFRNAANELAVVNEGLAETASIASNMRAFFDGQHTAAQKAISDNEAVRQKILDIIGG